MIFFLILVTKFKIISIDVFMLFHANFRIIIYDYMLLFSDIDLEKTNLLKILSYTANFNNKEIINHTHTTSYI